LNKFLKNFLEILGLDNHINNNDIKTLKEKNKSSIDKQQNYSI